MSKSGMVNVILLSAADNVVVACEQINAGASFEVGDAVIPVQSDVALGHKIARQDIGVDVFSYLRQRNLLCLPAVM